MFQTLQMIEGSIQSYSEAMRLLASDVQAFQSDGYKQSRYTFVSLYTQQINRMGGGAGLNRGAFNTQRVSQGVMLSPLGFNWSQGGLRPAEPTNAAVVGSGLFVLKPDNLNDFVYTRASDFVFTADGTLVDTFGRKVMGYKVDEDGTVDKSTLSAITVDPDEQDITDLGFEDSGALVTNFAARKSARESQDESDVPDGEVLFQLALAKVPNPSLLTAHSGNTYRTNAGSGEVLRYDVSGATGFGEIRGGFAESSNVDPAETTIIGIQLQRGYNAVQSALTLISSTLSKFLSAIDKA